MKLVRPLGAAVAVAALAACMPRAAPPAPMPAPVPPPAPRPAPPPPVPPPPDWESAPLSQGDWSYSQGPVPRAAFAAEAPLFVVECTAGRRIALARTGAAVGATLTVRTSFGERSLPAAGESEATVAMLAPADPLLDEIAFSRGRFLVRVVRQPDLILPSWPELARVIEDCRQ
jgi:hypothetical protein